MIGLEFWNWFIPASIGLTIIVCLWGDYRDG